MLTATTKRGKVYVDGGRHTRKESGMYETVKTIKGYKVKRMVGTHGFYHVDVCKGKYYTFKTIKAAVEFIEKAL